MAGLSPDNRVFLAHYAEAFREKEQLAQLATEFVGEALSDRDYGVHLVEGRAKSVDSLRVKLLLKNYSDPAVQVTDQIGVRVITYYGSKVDPIASRLRAYLTVDVKNSLDKRENMRNEGRFGYRSVHIVGTPSRNSLRDGRWARLRGQTIEVQVRSLLDHVWAEIEHELSYKSGIRHEVAFKRRFSAMAGMLELLEGEFLQLRAQLDELTDMHRDTYSQRRERTVPLDAARLTALLEVLWPDAPGWRRRERVGAPLPVSAATCTQALTAIGVTTARELEYTLNLRGCQKFVESYASNSGLAAEEVSHLVMTAIVVGYRDDKAMRDFFAPLLSEAAFSQIFARTDDSDASAREGESAERGK